MISKPRVWMLVLVACLGSRCAAGPSDLSFPTALSAAPTLALDPSDMPTALPAATPAIGSARDASVPDIVARVNGVSISREAFEAARAQAALYRAGQPLESGENLIDPSEDAQAGYVLDWLIDRALMAQAAAKMGVSVSEGHVDAALSHMRGSDATRFSQWLSSSGLTEEALREQLRDDLLVAALRDRVTASLLRETEQVHAAHILVGDRAKAFALYREATSGGSFAELAATHSEDMNTRARGGDLGFFPHGVMPVAFEEVAFSLPIGHVSEPVETELGYHIIRVLEHDPKRAIAADLWPAVQQRAFEEWLAQQRAQAQIDRFIAP